MENDSKQSQSLLAWFEEKVHQQPDKYLLAQDGTRLRYQTLNEVTSLFSGWLQTRAQLGRSARVLILMPNTIAYAVALFTIWRIGGCVVDQPAPSYNIVEYCQNSKVEAVIVASQYLDRIQPYLLDNKVPVVVSKPREYQPLLMRWQNLAAHKPNNGVWLQQAILEGRGLPYIRPEIHAIEAASLHGTSPNQRTNHQILLAQQTPQGYSQTLQYFVKQFFYS